MRVQQLTTGAYIAALALVLICAFVGKWSSQSAGSVKGNAQLDPVIRPKKLSNQTRTARSTLLFDGEGFRRYENCLKNETKYDILDEIFEDCGLECSSPGGCPKGCCATQLDGNQFMFCAMPGRCLRIGDNEDGGFVSLEYLRIDDAFPGRLVCPLQSLKYGEMNSSCAVRFDEFDERERACVNGISVPNTGQLTYPDTCVVGQKMDEVPAEYVDPMAILEFFRRREKAGKKDSSKV